MYDYVYLITNFKKEIIYVGVSSENNNINKINFFQWKRKEKLPFPLKRHLKKTTNKELKKYLHSNFWEWKIYDFYETKEKSHKKELELIKRFNPKFNRIGKIKMNLKKIKEKILENKKLFKFDKESHKYINIKTGKVALGVSTIASYGKYDEKNKNEFIESLAITGTEIHSITEEVDKFGEVKSFHLKITDEDRPIPFSYSYKKFLNDTKLNPVFVELMLYDEEDNIAGTIDRVYEKNGNLFICDIKTTSTPKVEHFIQLYLYKKLFEKVTGETIKDTFIFSLPAKNKARTFAFNNKNVFPTLMMNLKKIKEKEGIVSKLYPYQKKILDDIDTNKVGLFLDAGTGKSILSLAIYEKLFKKNKLLIVCIKSKIYEWKEDLEKWLPNLNVKILEKDLNFENVDVLISNFEKLPIREIEKFVEGSVLIVDESHKLNQINSYFKKLRLWNNRNYFKGIILLSGTPVAKEEDWANQVKFFYPKMTKTEFWKRFVYYEVVRIGAMRFNKAVGMKKEFYEFFDKLKRENFYFLKLNEADGMPDFKEKFIDFKNEFLKEQKLITKTRIIDDYLIEEKLIQRQFLRQLMNGFVSNKASDFYYKLDRNPKLEYLNNMLDYLPNSTIVFYNFKQELKDIKEILNEKKIKFYEQNGNKHQYMEALKDDEKHYLLIQYQSGSTGINLQKYNYMIMYSPPNSFIHYYQAKRRIFRKGQKNRVVCYTFRTKNSIEMQMISNYQNGEDYNNKTFIEFEETKKW